MKTINLNKNKNTESFNKLLEESAKQMFNQEVYLHTQNDQIWNIPNIITYRIRIGNNNDFLIDGIFNDTNYSIIYTKDELINNIIKRMKQDIRSASMSGINF